MINDNIPLFKFLQSLLTYDEQLEAVKRNKYHLLKEALCSHSVDTAKIVLEIFPMADRLKVLRADKFLLLGVTMRNSPDYETMKYLMEMLTPGERAWIVSYEHYAYLRFAAKRGLSKVLMLLMNFLDTEHQKMAVKYSDFLLLKTASEAYHHRVETMRVLMRFMTKEEIHAAFTNEMFKMFVVAVNNSYWDVAKLIFVGIGKNSSNPVDKRKLAIVRTINWLQSQQQTSKEFATFSRNVQRFLYSLSPSVTTYAINFVNQKAAAVAGGAGAGGC